MQLINKISIKYFRSLHIIDLKQCKSLNIISGRNDVGKSNILKALNLFFNGQSNWESRFDFYDEFSKKRLQEVRKDSVKGKQFISIKIEFIRPHNYKGSLPTKFTIERRWNRDSKSYEQKDNLSSFVSSGKLPSTLVTAQRSLAKLLNKIHFEYVPAIKDRAYVNDLLRRLQHSLLDVTIELNEGLLETANNLAEHIEEQIIDLKDDFEQATNIQTSIKPPSSISSLFQSFLVSTETNDGAIPLIFRGDGLQSRYIASVLHYISLNSKDLYIWGYEEPEIALEYSHANKMAEDFLNQYSKHAQIFLTTHSPAFISLEDDETSCYRVTQKDAVTNVANTALKGDINGKELLKEELGILDIQKEVHQYYIRKLADQAALNVRVNELENEMLEKSKPLVVTEGKTDKKILNIAYDKLYEEGENDFIIRECDNAGISGGNGGAGTLAKLIESIHPDDERVVIAVFDNDHEGQKEFNNLSKNFSSSDMIAEAKVHKNGYAWAILLNEPGFRNGYAQAKNLPIEYLFSDEVLSLNFVDGTQLTFKEQDMSLKVGTQNIDVPEELKNLIEEEMKMNRKIDHGKKQFANEIVPSLDQSKFTAFGAVFDIIYEIINT